MHEWTVAGGLIEQDGRILLVQNKRRDGSVDWTTPGGVIDEGETLVEGLTREVEEETGLRVSRWAGPLWEVHAVAPDMDWTLRVEVHQALEFEGDLSIDDPDGIVIDAAWFDVPGCETCLTSSWAPAREPMLAWLGTRWTDRRAFRYQVDGLQRSGSSITRLD